VWYDPTIGSYKELLTIFWELVSDPTHIPNGPMGPKQWATGIFWHTEDQRLQAGASLEAGLCISISPGT